MPGEGGRRGIPWGRREKTPAEQSPPAPTPPAADPAPDAGAQADQQQPTFDRVQEHDAAESALEHSHPSYRTIDRFPEQGPGGEPGFESAQEVDEEAYAQAESPAEASAHARVTREPGRE